MICTTQKFEMVKFPSGTCRNVNILNGANFTICTTGAQYEHIGSGIKDSQAFIKAVKGQMYD